MSLSLGTTPGCPDCSVIYDARSPIMIQQTMHEHLIGLSFERTVAEVQQVLTTYKESVDAAVAKRVEKITKLIEETKSEGSDADVVIAWAQRNTQWSQAPLRPAMLAMLTEATLASMERGLSKQLAALVGWLDVDVKRDPTSSNCGRAT